MKTVCLQTLIALLYERYGLMYKILVKKRQLNYALNCHYLKAIFEIAMALGLESIYNLKITKDILRPKGIHFRQTRKKSAEYGRRTVNMVVYLPNRC